MPELRPPLAGVFLRKWVDNRNSKATIEFDAPEHLKTSKAVKEVQTFHRGVFLTNNKARLAGGTENWVGALPRAVGAKGFIKWDMKSDLNLEYESLCDIAPTVWEIAKLQQFGSNADRDIFGSLRGFQLRSKVVVSGQAHPHKRENVIFKSWICTGKDRYDWNYSEYLTVVNPDYESKAADAIRPKDKTLIVYHTNAKRLEDAGQAAPYDVVLRPWKVLDASLLSPAFIDLSRKF